MALDQQKQLDDQRRKVDVDHFDLTIREIIRMAAEKELVRAPAYQRKFRWDERDESRLVESIFLGLPVPSIFVATNPDGTWEVVDGLQRVSTLIHFLAPNKDQLEGIGKTEALRLSEELETLTTFRAKTFADLPTSFQLSFHKRLLRVTALSDKSDVKVRFELFERLNTGGVALSAQEVRACIYRGDFADFLTQRANAPDFKKLVKLQRKKQDDGTREELVLKFFAYLNNRAAFEGDVTGFLNDYMNDSMTNFDFLGHRAIFDDAIATLVEITEGRPILRQGYHSTPLNQMEAILVAAGELIREGLAIKKPKKGWLDDRRLVRASTKGTNTSKMLADRIARAKELLTGKKVELLGHETVV